VAALAVLFGQTIRDLSRADADTCLLHPSPTRFASIPRTFKGGNAELCGAYGHRDGETMTNRRIGKVGPGKAVARPPKPARVFGVRGGEHKLAALLKKLQDRESRFYGSYPSMGAASPPATKLGWFEDLEMFIVMGYDQNDPVAVSVLCSSDAATGILQWPTWALNDIDKSSINGAATLELKQLHAVGYLFELAFELMLSPSADLSESPGFESFGLRKF
jgi:hypothetical protein